MHVCDNRYIPVYIPYWDQWNPCLRRYPTLGSVKLWRYPTLGSVKPMLVMITSTGISQTHVCDSDVNVYYIQQWDQWDSCWLWRYSTLGSVKPMMVMKVSHTKTCAGYDDFHWDQSNPCLWQYNSTCTYPTLWSVKPMMVMKVSLTGISETGFAIRCMYTWSITSVNEKGIIIPIIQVKNTSTVNSSC